MKPDSALVARVAAHPEELEARLACAEAFREDDAPRAELIRAQVALAGRGMDPARRLYLRKRVDTLLREHGKAWMAGLKELGASDFHFSRGFVEEVSLSEENLAEHGASLFALEPIHRLNLEVRKGKGKELARAVAQPWFEQVRWLKLSGGGVNAAVEALASGAHVGRLEGLVLSSADLEGVSSLARSEALSGLRSLSLTGNEELGDEGAEALAGLRPSLVRLYLTATGLSDEGAAVLARAKPLQSLELLALNRDSLSDEGAEALAASKVLTNLRRLELDRNELSEDGALAFRSPKALPALRQLSLREMGLSTRALEPLRKRLGNGLKL